MPPAYFQLTLDTTAPQGPVFTLAGGAAIVGNPTVAVVLTTTDEITDGYTVKFWGEVDPTFSPDIQVAEGDSAWVGYGTIPTLKLDADGGTVHAKIRDDVGNETATLDATVTVDLTLPIVTITVAPDRNKISKVDPWDETNFTFQVDSDVMAWMVKVVPNAAANYGVTIPETAGSNTSRDTTPATVLAANVPQTVKIMGADLQTAVGGDGEFYVKVFAQETASGQWST